MYKKSKNASKNTHYTPRLLDKKLKNAYNLYSNLIQHILTTRSFQMNFLKSLAIIATGIALAACGSSGSSAEHQHGKNTIRNIIKNSNSKSDSHHHAHDNSKQNSNKNNSHTNSQSTIGSYLTADQNETITTGFLADGKHDKLQFLQVHGQNIQLMPAADPNRKDPDFAEWRKDKTPFDALISTHLAHARYGSLAYLPGANNGQPYIFAQGNLSTTIPTHANLVTYQGRAILLGTGNDQTGTSQFTVHFDKKTVDGTLKFNSKPDIFLHGKIDGSHFNGKMGNVITRGAFYGKDAAELAGTFHQEGKGNKEVGDFAGAFGAKQQK